MRSEHDPLAVHIFIARRDYRRALESDTKSGKHSDRQVRDSYRGACDVGFRRSFEEWRRLMGAMAKR